MAHSYRSSQLISPFGPGSIIDIGEESLILMDISQWPRNLDEIKLERLTKEAGVWALKKPPVLKSRFEEANSYNSLMTTRFPKWMFCSRCRSLVKWKTGGNTNDKGLPTCSNRLCKDKVLVPMRFVAACDSGHLQDVPWDYWAHRTKTGYRLCEDPKDLYFESIPNKGSGLDALQVRCGNPECGAKSSLAEIMQENALKFPCGDSQPWEYKESSERNCDEKLRVLQRGASNLYYPITRSALDIPYDESSTGSSVFNIIKESDDFEGLRSAIDRGKKRLIDMLAEDIADEYNLTKDDVLKAMTSNVQESRKFRIPKDEDLRVAEWDILVTPNIEEKTSNTFKARIAKWDDAQAFGFQKYLTRIVLLDKLREVRAFCGFERIEPNDKPIIMHDQRPNSPAWLPATEVYGEGVFLEFDQMAIQQWESNLSDSFRTRLQDMVTRHANTSSTYLPIPSSKFVLMHTLAHLLVRQLSFESGYSSGSLRERIYAEEEQAGILIYTADGDSEGSLGGLVQQGEIDRLIPAILAALETANWCSNDPVCSEMEAQGVMGLNKAACHSCALISETSCEHNNLLLDRKILIGDNNNEGFFSAVLNQVNTGDY